MALTTKERKELKAAAHHLNPVVRIGQKGLTDNVVQETHLALEHHELIKVHIQGEREARNELAAALAVATGAELVSSIGKVSILFRPRAE